jgi:hypothetical protein
MQARLVETYVRRYVSFGTSVNQARHSTKGVPSGTPKSQNARARGSLRVIGERAHDTD